MLEIKKSEHGSNGSSVQLLNGLLFFGVGAAFGATLALLFAPKPGSELRGEIADATRKGYDATVERAIDIRDQTQSAMQSVKEKADGIYDLAAAKMAAGSDVVADVISTTKSAVKEGIERIENEAGIGNANRASGRRPSSVM